MPAEIAYNWMDGEVGQTAVSTQEALFVRRLQANEDAAYDELVQTYSASIFHVAYRMLGDTTEASDVAQEVFLKVFRNIGGFRGKAMLKTWIFKIAFSETLNQLRWWRRRQRFTMVSLDEQPNGAGSGFRDIVAGSDSTPEQTLQAKEEEAAIQQALLRLPPRHRSIIVLRDIEGLSYYEIASVLGVSVGTVKSRLARARGDLKKSLMRYWSVR